MKRLSVVYLWARGRRLQMNEGEAMPEMPHARDAGLLGVVLSSRSGAFCSSARTRDAADVPHGR
ncbi:hypothetical protein CH63R_14045 [Colletotrichum higginsianum IMI 349063]|uniref:Uncharacterized protein n=1 Tax=Colletotrichum higginsianum (strain IMI 349063) TaxID=759273 RepID=A0A1B7XST1_COLHI|nr:hypothetical protein CH63R_14045 [Colletotrichum higginsianum IMI 349063]OBR02819.1 hypothetical protein CH63R_14045 [Colletotrichum higginsianum IMI 349063]